MILWRECGGRWGARGQALSTPPVAIRPDGHFGPMLSPAGLPYNLIYDHDGDDGDDDDEDLYIMTTWGICVCMSIVHKGY